MSHETPLEMALKRRTGVEYCDQCANWIIVNDAAYCKASGKLIHLIMYRRGKGSGPARNCEDKLLKVEDKL